MLGRLKWIAPAVVLAVVGATGSRAAVPGIPSFYVDYQPSCTFSMSVDPGTLMLPGSAGTTLPPGTYQLLISMPNPSGGYSPCATPAFTLTGPGVSLRFEFAGVELHEERVFTVPPSSSYTAQDENAPAATRRVFTTSASGSSTSLVVPATTQGAAVGGEAEGDLVGSAVLRYRGKLVAAVTATGKATLTLRGRKVGSLTAGNYDVAGDDRDEKAGFAVRHGTYAAVPVTSAAFVGTRTKRVAFAAGSWSFFAKPGSVTRFTVVSAP